MSDSLQATFDAVAAQSGKHTHEHPAPIILHHTLFLLPIFAAISLVILALRLLIPRMVRLIRRRRSGSYQPLLVDEDADVPQQSTTYQPSQGLMSDMIAHIRSLQALGKWLFGLEVIRLLCIGTLLGLSIYAVIQAESPVLETKDESYDISRKWGGKHGKKKHRNKHPKPVLDYYSHLEWAEFGVCTYYLYTLFASFLLLTLGAKARLRRHLSVHIDMLLLAGVALYAYRDLYPLFTFTLHPSDVPNAITWSRIGILGLAGVVIPLIRPRVYIPADPLNPSAEKDVHPEQTTPLLSFVFYEFMTGLIMKAWRKPSLPYEDLHPLADYDRASFLLKNHILQLDPVKRKAKGLKNRHLFIGLLSVFWKQALIMAVMVSIKATSEFAAPLSINRLLNYIETSGHSAVARPIVWILVLFLGPTIGSLAMQFYIFTSTRALVRCEALLTQLLFDHSLRIRMKEAVEDEKKVDGTETPAIRIEDTSDVVNGHTTAEGCNLNFSTSDSEVDSSTDVGSGSGDSHKAKADAKAKKSQAESDAAKPKGKDIVGKINVLMSSDLESIIDGRDVFLIILYAPIQVVLAIFSLYQILSWSSLIGMAVMIITLPIPGLIAKRMNAIQHELMAATDARVDAVTESLNAIRVIKMFAWEERIKERIKEKREIELQCIRRKQWFTLASSSLNHILPVLVMLATFTSYTTIEGKSLTASKVFTSITVFELLRNQMHMIFWLMTLVITAKVSLQRVNGFLQETELLDEFTDKTSAQPSALEVKAQGDGAIRIHDAVFAWISEEDKEGKDFSAIRNFRLRIPELAFVKGKLNLIAGPTGCGKSSLLQALLGEMHFEPSSPESFFHLPRGGGVSYAAQESWCMSDTIKENIIFGRPYDKERYDKVIYQCGLTTDLSLFDDGDETEVGEKGLTLSGGQKARITLARAIYSDSAVVLLDDVFSALDTLTSRWIIDHCFRGDLVQGRTILLVTHHISLAAPVAAYIVSLNEDGTVSSQGPVEEVIKADGNLQKEVEQDQAEVAAAKEDPDSQSKPDAPKPAAKLVVAEEKGEGRISRQAMMVYVKALGGPWFWVMVLASFIGTEVISAFENYWLGIWARAYEDVLDVHQVNVVYYLGIWIAIVLGAMIAWIIGTGTFYTGIIRASRSLHLRLVNSIFSAYSRFLDQTPIGRIISRFTKDTKACDGNFSNTLLEVIGIAILLIVKFIAIVILVPWFVIPGIFIGVIGTGLAELYIHGQLSVKREMSNAKSPLFSHFGAAIAGIVSIRAYGAQDQLRVEARKRVDKYTRTATAFYNLNRWVTVRIDLLGGVFSASLATFLVYYSKLDASSTGFTLSMSITFSAVILWWVRMLNEVEVQGNSVERIQDYLVIDHEPETTEKGKPPAAWPTSGKIVFEKYSARYSKEGPVVLDELSLSIRSGERIGIVGRTGSGKSTLALAVLRMIPTSGKLYIDDVAVDSINLDALRTHVTIIPQDPVLLSGSMRFNLDPFGEHDDATLNDALQSSGLGATSRSEMGAATPMRLTLDTQLAAGGSNLSQGQRQLVALARALVRQSKILILDEATASVDFQTDSLIQESIRKLQDVTILTVAHRLSTVLEYDRILVLGAGKILEFDTPEKLTKDKSSYFSKLVDAMEG